MRDSRLPNRLLIPAALLCSLLLVGCEKEQEVAEEIIRPVRYLEVQPTTGRDERIYAGTSRDTAATRMSFRVAGRVSYLGIKLGDRTTDNQVIARLDAADLQLRVQEARAALDQAKANQRNAASVLARVRGLYENNNASRNELDGARANAEAADAAVASIANQLQLVQRQLGYTVLRAPAVCDVATMDVEVNENVAAGQPIALLGCGGETEVKVQVPGSVISAIRQGDKVEVRFAEIDGHVFPATVTEVGVAATEVGTTFPVTVKIDEEPIPLRSGLSGEVKFKVGSTDGAGRMILPLAAVGGDLRGRFVFVLKHADKKVTPVVRQPVEVGTLTGTGIEVLKGLEAGQKVVTAGVSQLRDGQKVSVLKKLEVTR